MTNQKDKLEAALQSVKESAEVVYNSVNTRVNEVIQEMMEAQRELEERKIEEAPPVIPHANGVDPQLLADESKFIYHLATCYEVPGIQNLEPISKNDAKELGLTPCNRCNP
eukprot:TRINITY_DN4370_c0_g1_i3.p1 TRINITY_DN4370_c0_g1~~TRINITY_DN4370_c0_g1_i3.p1  ORF type:complete len:111 (+),score=14.30 TRINITY_DN4370_c0_g1_i3:328-660(+)